MTKIKDIHLPLRKTHKIDGTDQDMIDLLFDLKVQDMTRLLDHLHVKNEPMLAVVNMPQWGKVVMVFMFLPPDIWLDFDHQKYQIYLAPDINTMIHFFVARKINSRDTLEIEILVKIIEYLQLHLTNQRVSHTW